MLRRFVLAGCLVFVVNPPAAEAGTVFAGGDPGSQFLIDELSVRDFGTSATVMGRLRGVSATDEVTSESRYLHAYVRRRGHWWIVAAVGSAVQKQAATGK